MNIVFIQQFLYEWQAPMIFSALAKARGHAAYMIIDNSCRDAARKALSLQPDLIVFSNINSGNMEFVYDCARIIKENCDLKILVGGVYISLNYSGIHMEHIDMLGIGEGETMFCALLDTGLQGNRFEKVPGLIFKEGEKIRINQPQCIGELDQLPFPDRAIYYTNPLLRKEKVRMFYSGRGCKYNCSYCCVPQLVRINAVVPPIRKRSPDSLIREILEVDSKWGMKAAFFQDDTFTQDRQWLEEFLPLYKKYVDKPFMCMTRARDIAEEKTVELLHACGCISVGIGIETANEGSRWVSLNRKESNATIRNAVSYLRKRNIRITTFNMIGLPGETLADVYETLDFNHRLKVDSAWAVFYQPYRKSETDSAKDTLMYGNFYSGLPGDHPDKDKLQLLQRYFPYIVKHPFLMSFIHYKALKKASYLFFALHSFSREIYIWHRSFLLTLICGIRNQLQYKKMTGEHQSDSVKQP